MEIIKSRPAKMSQRGIYIQDKELLETSFLMGSYFKFEEFPAEQRVFIHPSSEQGKNTVSKRKMNGYIKPVLDIRKKSVLGCFTGCEHLQVIIYKDLIEIVGVIGNDSEN